jgi:hypothetical protein
LQTLSSTTVVLKHWQGAKLVILSSLQNPGDKMIAAARYFNLWKIDPASDHNGYICSFMPDAQEFFQQRWFSHQRPEKKVLTDLLLCFKTPETDIDQQAYAGLCLRCYVSEPILMACRKIDYLFGTNQSFNYRDLLPFVLNDDGKTLMILDPKGKATLRIEPSNSPQAQTYQCFSIQILRSFKPNSKNSMSLDNWAYLQTKQNPDLKKFLSEFGFQQLSDWALLNRTRSKQLEQLPPRDRCLVEVFHAVYRRDRQQQNQGTKRCLDPTVEQLQEMATLLIAYQRSINPPELMSELRRLALQLRQYDIWCYREPLELQDLETGAQLIRSDLPLATVSEFDVEQQEFLAFFHEQLQLALEQSIRQEIENRITHLKKSKGYAAFADQLIPGLCLYYRQGIALKEIATLLGMSNWAQARRILNPGELINTVRTLTIRQVLHKTLAKAEAKGLISLPPTPDYLESLVQQIEAVADFEIFQEAFDEIQAGKNRSLKSVYAQALCCYLDKCANFTVGVP